MCSVAIQAGTVEKSFVYVVGGVAAFGAKDTIERAAINSDGTLGAFSDTGQRLVTKLEYASATKLPGALILAGGFDGTAPRADGEALTFDSAGTLTNIAAVPLALTTARSAHTAELIGNDIVVIGGYGSGYLWEGTSLRPTSSWPYLATAMQLSIRSIRGKSRGDSRLLRPTRSSAD